MNYWSKVQQLVDQVIAGQGPTRSQGVDILQAKGSEYSAYLAGAHHLKEQAFGNTAQLCSIINAKSGRCQENCSFCAQSAHHQSSPPVYPLKSKEEIIKGAEQAQAEGSHCYGIVTSGTKPEFGEEFGKEHAARTRDRPKEVERNGGCAVRLHCPYANVGLFDNRERGWTPTARNTGNQVTRP